MAGAYRIFNATIEIKTATDIESAPMDGLTDTTYLLFGTLLVACALLAVWSNATKATPDELLPTFGRRATGVFLRVTIRIGDRTGTGHVTTLGTRAATLIADLPLERGAVIELDLTDLPDFDGAMHLKATVRHVHRLRRSKTATVTVRVHFADVGAAAAMLSGYVGQLGAAARVSHA
jgi:hypothetical protein